MPVVWPIHPRTRDVVAREGLALDGIIVTDPVGYFDMHALLAHAAQVFTDSGGLRKEAYFHRVPCVTLRRRPMGRDDRRGLEPAVDEPRLSRPRTEIADYGDGTSSAAIAALLLQPRTAR